MAGWFGKRERQRQEERNAALNAIMEAAQDRSIPTMRVNNPGELIFYMGVTSQEQGDLAGPSGPSGRPRPPLIPRSRRPPP
jgi:hypothetical protein